jgi:hypothetical protein
VNNEITVNCTIEVENLDEIERKAREVNTLLEKASSLIKELAEYDGLKVSVEI